MADNTAYTALQNAVKALQDQLDAAYVQMNKLINDYDFVWMKAVLNDPRVVNTVNGWISGASTSGTFWKGPDAQKERDHAILYIVGMNDKIKAQQNVIDNLKLRIKDAQDRVTNYEKNSPVLQAQIAADQSKTLQNTVVTIAGIFVFLLIVFGVYKLLTRTKSKGAAPAAAAA